MRACVSAPNCVAGFQAAGMPALLCALLRARVIGLVLLGKSFVRERSCGCGRVECMRARACRCAHACAHTIPCGTRQPRSYTNTDAHATGHAAALRVCGRVLTVERVYHHRQRPREGAAVPAQALPGLLAARPGPAAVRPSPADSTGAGRWVSPAWAASNAKRRSPSAGRWQHFEAGSYY